MSDAPSDTNDYLVEHIRLLGDSYRRLTGRDLLGGGVDRTLSADYAREVWQAPFVVLSHGIESDPIFDYANLSGQRLFELDWSSIAALPSRYSAEPIGREERARLLAAVTAQGFIDDYQGVRISSSGRRFRIEQATVWNLFDADGIRRGQAARFERWIAL